MSRLSTWDESRKARLRQLWPTHSVAAIAAELRTSRGAVYVKAKSLGLPGRRAPRPASRPLAIGAGPRDQSGQRRFLGRAHDERTAPLVLKPHHPAYREGSTIYGATVRPAMEVERLLKSGEHSRKVGGEVTKGRWRGFPLVTLTLEERETCPRSCAQWASCFGNHMHMATRIADDGTLTRRLFGELAALNVRHPRGFGVRLHVLGDFYSLEYVAFWREMLELLPALHVFGFTARAPGEPIGDVLQAIRTDHRARFAVRTSGAGGGTGGAEVVDRPEEATGILCPAQRDPHRCCATCALCWQSDRTITFLRH